MSKIHPRLIQFDREFKGVDFADYFQLKKGLYEYIDIHNEVVGSSIYLTIRYTKKTPCPLFKLPPEMMAKIRSYLTYKIELKLKIIYSSEYPFYPPIWFLKEVTHTIPYQIDLTEYYCYKVNCHNSKYVQNLMDDTYGSSWTPAVFIEKDILMFIEKINHFDKMLVVY
jgi:hypothetical protein